MTADDIEQLEVFCDKWGFDIDRDNEGQIIIYTGWYDKGEAE